MTTVTEPLLSKTLALTWIRLGIFCGFAVSILYPALLFVSGFLPALVVAVLLCVLLSLASVGLYYFVTLHSKRITAQIAVVANMVASAMFLQMLLVQLAIKASRPESFNSDAKWIWNTFQHIHYGLDVAWDVSIFLGTFMFAWSAYRHPKLGKVFSFSGILIAWAMILINLATFPNPPASSGLIDLGPLVGLWYMAVTIKILLSWKWVKNS